MKFFRKSFENLGIWTPKSLLPIVSFLALAGCGGGGASSFDFASVPTTGTGVADCAITNSTPTTDSLKVSNLGSTLTTFTVGLARAVGCPVTYTVNGVALPSTTAAVDIASSSLNAGNNTIIAKVGSSVRTWTVFKNTPPSCLSQTPNAMGNTMSPGASVILTGNGGDNDGDALTFSWKVNSNAVSTSVLNTFNGTTSSQATFTPTTSFLGANNIELDINDGTDVTACTWTVGVAGSCSIASTTPAAPGPVRVAYNAGTTTPFSITTSSGCLVTWSLNAVKLPGNGMSETIGSPDLMIGSNILQVSVTNGTSTDSKTWAVVKNSPPNCASQTPGITGNTVGVSSSITLTANGSDLNNDALTYSWKNNGSPVDGSIFAVTGNSTHSQAVFTPSSSYVGTNTVRADISDGYDTTSCSWTVAVVPTCQVLSSTPSSTTPRIPFNGAATNSFVAVANDPSCGVTWSLNGSPLGGTTPFQNLTSSQFTAGPATNTLKAHFSNGFSATDQTWTVTRNTPATCDSQVPAAAGAAVGVNAPLIFTANALDANNDPVTFSWRSNGNPANPAQFVTSASGLTGHATFTPNSGYIGANTISADISDGYDTASCTWNVNVVNNCSVASSNPPTATTKVANAASTSTTFFVSPSDSSCAVSWTLNGGTVPGSTVLPLLSSDFLDGPTTNSLVATLNNGYTTPVTRVWTVTKNRIPVCATQTPVTNPAAMPYQTTKNFTANASDPDGDTLSGFTWTYNGSTSGTLFNPINTVGAQSVATFKPTLTQVGVGQSIVASFNDGLDSGSCTWGFDIVDPNTVNITSCTPTANPVIVTSTGPLASQVLTANATGNGLSYQWYQNSSVQSGFTNPTFSISSSSLTVGNYTFKGLVTDAYGNSQHCDWTVKVNAPPVIGTVVPVATQTWKLNYNATMAFGVSATDANNDTLTYAWTLDGVASATLPSGTASTTFTPNGTLSLIGAHTVTVTVSDGSESVTQTWNVEVNYFSNDCNTLMNSTVAAAGGNICTLVGIPTMGNGNTPSADQTQMRIHPAYATDDGAGNLIFTDQLNNTVNYYNKSGANISRFGITIPAGKMVVVMGNGANGVTPDNLYRTAFKLNQPMDLAYDQSNGRLYVADYANHRIAMMDSTGLATTVFGVTGSAANATASNTDGSAGTVQGCGSPVGLRLVSYGGSKWLYVACSGTHSIKRMNADSTSGNFGKGYLVAGKLSTTNTTTAGSVDGLAGPTGDAYVNQPWALSDDNAGNIYFTESAGTYRVRMVTTGGSAMSFFTGARTVSGALGITATDMTASTPLTAASFNTQAVAVSGPETQVTIDGMTSAVTGACVPLHVRILNASNSVAALSAPNTIVLGGAGTGGAFYSEATCTTALAGGGVNLAMTTGQSEAQFYYKKTSAGSVTLTSNGTGLTQFPGAGGKVLVVGASGTPSKLTVVGPGTYDYTACAKVTVQIQSSGSQASLSGAIRTIRMSHNASGSFYTDAACATTPVVNFTMAATDSELHLYFARTVVASAGNTVVSLFGNANTNSVFPTTVGTPASVGAVTLRYPRGLAVYAPSGVVKGFFVNSWDQYRTLFVDNAATTLTFGGAAIPSQQAGVVLGTGTGGFNADGLGSSARTYTGYGLTINSAGDTLLFPDYDNYRMRIFDINSNNGNITTLIGAGRARSGNLGDSPTPATSMYLNGPSQVVVDSTARKLYISDSGNGRIRRTDLLTGTVDTIIGKGTGAATVEDEDPTNVLMQSPRALSLITSGGINFLAYADQASNTSANSDCMIRAMNLSVTTNATNFFGQAISKGRVDTLAGNYVKGCLQWNAGTPNTNGMAATNAQLYNPEGLASDGTNLYISLYNDHCIVKELPDGTISQLIGTCGTAGTLDGNTTVATITSPMGITIDPSYSADGNFFFADAPANNPSRVRYVNFRTSSVTIGSSTVPAAPGGGVGIVQTLWTISPSGNSAGYINNLAAFSNQLCMAGGLQGNGGAGSHNVTCYDRSSPLGPVTLRVGPNEATGTPTRGGAPLDLTQENAYSGNALLNSPYGISFDSSGNLYLSERNNHIVRFVRPVVVNSSHA